MMSFFVGLAFFELGVFLSLIHIFPHNGKGGFIGELSFLRQLFHSLRLRQGRCVLGLVHGLQKIPLLSLVQIGQFHSGIEGDFLFIYKVEQFGNEIRQADKPLDIPGTLTSIFCKRFICSELRANLARS